MVDQSVSQRKKSGGTMVTLAALCNANGLDMSNCGGIELNRIWLKIPQIQLRHAAKPNFSKDQT